MNCSALSDRACSPCRACGDFEYEACGCGAYSAFCQSGNRVCFSYHLSDVLVSFELFSPFVGLGAYFNSTLATLGSMVRARSVVVIRVDASPTNQSTTDFEYLGLPGWSVLPSLTRYSFTVQLGGVYQVTGLEGLLERALFEVEDRMLHSSPGRRRLLQLAGCDYDTYLHDFVWATLCVPCAYDPNPLATQDTPPLLMWTLTGMPCPLNSARVCFGGYSSPLCVQRVGGATLGAVVVTSDGFTACPGQQVGIVDPQTNQPLCAAVLCTPGTTGDPGYCVSCRAGAFKGLDGGLPCSPCPIGTYSPAHAAACTACPAHSISGASSSDCHCEAGYAGNSQGCAQCVRGSYSPGVLPSCIACPAGAHAPVTGLSACPPCAAGSVSNTLGASACSDCASGTYQNLPFQALCLPCPSGTYSNLTSCLPCPSGMAGTSGFCLLCPQGEFNPSPGATECTRCPPALGPTPSHERCEACRQGQHSPNGTCLPCHPGSYSSLTGQSECRPCEAGSNSPLPGASACPDCPAGSAGLHCAPCWPGSYATGTGQTACTPCRTGLFSGATGAAAYPCRTCPAGSYWADPSACTPCPEFTQSPPGAESVGECFAGGGYFGTPGQPARMCPTDHFCARGAMQPTPCPEGTSADSGASRCEAPWLPGTGAFIAWWNWAVVPVWAVMVLSCAGWFALRRRRHAPTPPQIRIRMHFGED